MLGITPEDVEYTPEHWIATIHPEDRPRMLEAWKIHLQGKTPFYESEYRIRIKTGEWKWILDRGRVVERDADNRALRMTGTHLDITGRVEAEEEARRRQEQLRQADKMISLGILVSGVAHEINNPNHFIMSHVAPLTKVWRSITPILREYYENNGDFSVAGMNYTEARSSVPAMLDAIQEGSTRIKTIVDELRDYAREQPASGFESVQINRVIRSAVTLLSNMIKRATSNFCVEYGEDLPKLRGNYQRLEQVIINLIQNACEALTDPGQKVCVKTSYHPETHEIRLEISDEGPGIPEDALSHITDPFFTTKRDSGGTGLGLSISSNIVHEHRGGLEFRSSLGQGATVIVCLPAETTSITAVS
ncbi:MAG: PAS domain-containing protein [Proteobacteria bacterium]|nr:PAS domain-containing protein [Pseudomonadota bacterium]